jgi:hypothetical protein
MPMEPDSDGPAAHPKCDDLTADLARLARRGRPLSCFISKADPGYRIMTNRASSKVQELMHAGMMSVAFMDDADHTFSFRAPRLALVRAIGDHFLQRYQR